MNEGRAVIYRQKLNAYEMFSQDPETIESLVAASMELKTLRGFIRRCDKKIISAKTNFERHALASNMLILAGIEYRNEMHG